MQGILCKYILWGVFLQVSWKGGCQGTTAIKHPPSISCCHCLKFPCWRLVLWVEALSSAKVPSWEKGETPIIVNISALIQIGWLMGSFPARTRGQRSNGEGMDGEPGRGVRYSAPGSRSGLWARKGGLGLALGRENSFCQGASTALCLQLRDSSACKSGDFCQ